MSVGAQGTVIWEGKGGGAAVCHLDEAGSQQGFHRRTERRTEPSQGLCSEHGRVWRAQQSGCFSPSTPVLLHGRPWHARGNTQRHCLTCPVQRLTLPCLPLNSPLELRKETRSLMEPMAPPLIIVRTFCVLYGGCMVRKPEHKSRQVDLVETEVTTTEAP